MDDREELIALRRLAELEAKASGQQPQATGGYEARKMAAEEAALAGVEGEQTMPETWAQMAGQGIGAVFDPIVEAVSPVAKFAERSISNLYPRQSAAIKGAIKPAAEMAAEQYSNLSPRAQRNIEAAANIFGILPTGRVGATIKGAAESGLVAGGEKLIQSGANLAAKQKYDFVKNLVSPVLDKRAAEEAVWRTGVKGKIFKTKEIGLTKQEMMAADEVNKIEGVSDKKLLQENFNIIRAANEKEAIALKKKLSRMDVNLSKDDVFARIDSIASNLEQNPFVSDVSQQAAIRKSIDAMKRKILSNKMSASGLLEARKQFDKIIKEMGRERAFNPNTETAVSMAIRDVRRAVNDIIEESVPNAEVKSSLAKQNALFNALDNISEKANILKEPATTIGRINKAIDELSSAKGSVAKGIALGAGGIGASFLAPSIIPAMAAVGVPGYLAYKAATSPGLRTGFGKLLKAAGSAQPNTAVGNALMKAIRKEK